jgi:predicted outer membrane repeat protein
MPLVFAPAVLAGTVVNTADSGAGSLRQVIAGATAGETIDFAIAGSPPHVIVLTTGAIVIAKTVNIEGLGPNQLEISGNDASRVFEVLAGSLTSISAMTIRNGASAIGGCIALGGADPTMPGAGLVLDGVVIRDCDTTTFGGGLALGYNSVATIRDSELIANHADLWGGAIYSSAHLTVSASEFADNTSGQNGGAIFSTGKAVVTGTEFVGNESTDQGGAFFNLDGTASFTDTLFEGNSTGMHGGAIINQGNPCNATVAVTVVRSRVTDNEAGANAGGILNADGCALSIRDSMIDSNRALMANGNGHGGGILTAAGSTLAVVGTTIAGNVAENGGGGIFIDVGTASLINTTLSGNSSTSLGGAMWFAAGAQGYLSNVTVTNNTSAVTGGVFDGAGSAVELRNSIVAGNFGAGDPPHSDCSGQGASSEGHNLVGSNTGCPADGSGDKVVNPLHVTSTILAPLAATGGLGAAHAPLLGSPVLDMGDPAGCKDHAAAAIMSDQRGAPRPLDGDGNATMVCDIGAYEAAPPAQLLADIDGNGMVQALTDGLLMLRFAFGFTGATLVSGAVAGNCLRCTAAEIVAYLNLLF